MQREIKIGGVFSPLSRSFGGDAEVPTSAPILPGQAFVDSLQNPYFDLYLLQGTIDFSNKGINYIEVAWLISLAKAAQNFT